MSSVRTKKRSGYSLIEMMVVLGVIVMIGIVSLPNIFSQNERASLDSSAQMIRQVIIDAYTRSLAPTRNDESRTGQIYQVAFGNFITGQPKQQGEFFEVSGNTGTNKVWLERGLARCDSGDVQGGFSTLKSISLPRGIFVSSFFPSDQPNTEAKSVIRFSAGVEGFQCGSYTKPNIKSDNYRNDFGWTGEDKSLNQKAYARYLVIELSANKIPEHRYVIMDRLTKEVSAVNSNPQSYFASDGDSAVPKWTSISNDDDMTLSIECRANDADMLLTFKRAEDRPSATENPDPNLAVYYDIDWDLHNGSGYVPLSLKYFYDLGRNEVKFSFTTTAMSVASRPAKIGIQLKAQDEFANMQLESTPADPLLRWWQKDFIPSCGDLPVTEVEESPPSPIPPQGDPGGEALSCGPTAWQPHNWLLGIASKLGLVERTFALVESACDDVAL